MVLRNHAVRSFLLLTVSTTTTLTLAFGGVSTQKRVFQPQQHRQSLRLQMLDTATSITRTTTKQEEEESSTDEDDMGKCMSANEDAVVVVDDIEKARRISEDFQITEPFNPPAVLSNQHVQTIGGFLTRSTTSYNPCGYIPNTSGATTQFVSVSKRIKKALDQKDTDATSKTTDMHSYWDDRERIETPDGDWFHADTRHAENADAHVILIHGLESNSNSPAVIDMARSYSNNATTVTCLNFRGCSGTSNDTPAGYHLGFTDDLKLYLTLLNERYAAATNNDDDTPPPAFYLSGFSLGANVVLKCLGEFGATAKSVYNVHGGAVLCAPLHQRLNCIQLARPGINKSIYTQLLLTSMQTKARELQRVYPNLPNVDYDKIAKVQTITEFDDTFIAPIYNFTDCWDYYDQTSSMYFLPNITVPTFILNAFDDPFMDPAYWPADDNGDYCPENDFTSTVDTDKNTVVVTTTTAMEQKPLLLPPVKLLRSEHGGHLGFAFHQISNPNDKRLDGTSPSWSATQLSRFITHVHTYF